MALAISLRRALFMLLAATVFVIMVLYWNQSVTKPHFFMGTNYEKSLPSYTNPSVLPSSVEKMWTYKCESNKCVRHHFPSANNKAEHRVPFMTCVMSCGDINIWPMPTIRSVISTKSLTFTAHDVHLRVNTPFNAVDAHIKSAFKLFMDDLRLMQRWPTPDETLAEIDKRWHTSDGPRHQRRRHVDNSHNMENDLTDENYINRGTAARQNAPNTDINSIIVHVDVQKSDDLNISFDTDESYQLTVASEQDALTVHIMANSFFGSRHALSTLEQLIWYDDEDNLLRIISKALIIDRPKFRYRGLMLDTSRHFFSVSAIKRTIMAMSHAKLNRFHWHITDSQSFPYISQHYPELAAYGAYSDRETYTPDDIRDVVAFAKLHGVQVLPEIDAPAHAGNGWDWGPKRGLGELSLCINQQPWSFYCGEPPCGQLNPKNNNTYLILQRLYEELLNLTGPTDYFHLGGDEVNLECWGQYFNDTDLRGLWCDFMLNALARLKLANKNVEPKIVAVWSSGLTNTKCLPKSQFAVQVWGGSTWQENYDLIDNGFNVIFSHVDAWYLDCGFGNWRSTGEGACSPYRTWQNVYKHRPWERMRLDKARRNQVLGGEVCMWTEQVDESQLDNRLWPRSAALGERLWSDPDDEHDVDILPQDVFKRMSIFRNRLVELGHKAEPIFPKFCAQNPGECI